jgi:hypothetical protein
LSASLTDTPLEGVQEPRLRSVPPYHDLQVGKDAVELALGAGLALDPWQALSVELTMARRLDHKWAAFEAAHIIPRQNGKGGIIEARELAGLFLLGETILHSTHHFRTTRGAFERLKALIENCPELDAQVRQVFDGHGQEGVELKNGAVLAYVARSKQSGRGLSPDVVVIDEAFEYPRVASAALLPSMAARRNPQILYTSSPPDKEVHHNALVLAGLRQRALLGGDPSLLWLEWSVDQALYELARQEKRLAAFASDPRNWALSNPALGYRLTAEFIANEMRSLRPTSREFAVERLGVGYWPDPEEDEEVDLPIDPELFMRLIGSAGEPPLDPTVLGVDVSPDGWTSITACGWRRDGRKHLEVIAHAAGTAWFIPVLTLLVQAHDPAGIVLDRAGRAASLLPDLEAAGYEPHVTNLPEMAAACRGMVDDAEADLLRWVGDPLEDAIEALRWRAVGKTGAQAFTSSGKGRISPAVAGALARFGLLRWVPDGPPVPSRPPVLIPSSRGRGAAWDGPGGFDAARAGF